LGKDKDIKYLIIAGGKSVNGELIQYLAAGVDKIVCADSGAEIARRTDIVPNAIIGDLDSVSEGTLAYFKRMDLMEVIEDQGQESTDLEKALLLALNQGANKIIITCATGNRMDHFLYNISLLSKFHNKADITLIDDYDIVVLKKDSFTDKCTPGERISLIPWGGKVKNVATDGLKYKITGKDMQAGVLESISNEATADTFSVSFTSGMVLLIRSLKKLEKRDSRQIKIDFNSQLLQ
jgi:thiamine pyrophosphokinase